MQVEKSRPGTTRVTADPSSSMTVKDLVEMGAVTEIERLEKAIKDLHGFRSTHVQSVPVEETFQANTVWKGVIEVFQLHHHRRAGFAFAWSYKDEDGKEHYVAVLGVPPVNLPIDAVRAYIAGGPQAQKT